MVAAAEHGEVRQRGLEAFGGYTAYQMDPDSRAIKWTTDQIGPAVFYYSQELNETFLSVCT